MGGVIGAGQAALQAQAAHIQPALTQCMEARVCRSRKVLGNKLRGPARSIFWPGQDRLVSGFGTCNQYAVVHW